MSKDDRELIATLRGLLATATPELTNGTVSQKTLADLLRLGAEHQRPQADNWNSIDWRSDAALIVAAIESLPALLTRLEALQAQPVGEESGWLIEMVEPDHNKSPVPRWWHPEHGWTWDANKALRFAREIDAQDYILGSGRLPGKPTEHMFLDSAGGEA